MLRQWLCGYLVGKVRTGFPWWARAARAARLARLARCDAEVVVAVA